jgi:hypothetical protein
MKSNATLKPTLSDLTFGEVAVVILIVSFLMGMIATPKVKTSPLKQDGPDKRLEPAQKGTLRTPR